MNLTIKYQTIFKKDYKRVKRRGYDMRLLESIVKKLAAGEALEEKNHNHALAGNWNGYRECSRIKSTVPIFILNNNTEGIGFLII